MLAVVTQHAADRDLTDGGDKREKKPQSRCDLRLNRSPLRSIHSILTPDNMSRAVDFESDLERPVDTLLNPESERVVLPCEIINSITVARLSVTFALPFAFQSL